VPFLHSNYSFFEALFLQIRSLNHDMPKKFVLGIGVIRALG
jgi:hypothetical protein